MLLWITTTGCRRYERQCLVCFYVPDLRILHFNMLTDHRHRRSLAANLPNGLVVCDFRHVHTHSHTHTNNRPTEQTHRPESCTVPPAAVSLSCRPFSSRVAVPVAVCVFFFFFFEGCACGGLDAFFRSVMGFLLLSVI